MCRVLHCVVTWYRIWQSNWQFLEHMILVTPKHCEFLHRTENLNTHDNEVLAVDWNWTASTTAMPSNTHGHSSYSVTKHDSNLHRYQVCSTELHLFMHSLHCVCTWLLTITSIIMHRHCLSQTTDMTHMHTSLLSNLALVTSPLSNMNQLTVLDPGGLWSMWERWDCF